MTTNFKSLMIQGTGSGVGKSILTAAFCRWFKKRGVRVAPFKAQNMSLNSFITEEGHEMGRAQAYQAQACGIQPHVCMNPVLLKPSGDNMSQVILMGNPRRNADARQYYNSRDEHFAAVQSAFDYLKEHYEMVVIEGAGSPAEINLKKNDIVNMTTAKMANAPVLIVGDIDRGGVFAWMKGTYDLLTEEEQARVGGFIINKFRGDINLLTPGIEMFEEMVKKPVLGVIPFQRDLFVDEEDAIPTAGKANADPSLLNVVILRLPRISNFTDFTPLVEDPNVSVRYVWQPSQIGHPDLLIIPGSKNTLADCLFLKEQGLDTAIQDCHKQGSIILGVCAGFQILGKTLKDPEHIESKNNNTTGLGLFEMNTTLQPEKITRQVNVKTCNSPILNKSLKLTGYEIHMGTTEYEKPYPPLFSSKDGHQSESLGICNENGSVVGTYLHGLFDSDPFREAFLNRLRRVRGLPEPTQEFDFSQIREEQFEKLASLVENHIDHQQVMEILDKHQ